MKTNINYSTHCCRCIYTKSLRRNLFESEIPSENTIKNFPNFGWISCRVFFRDGLNGSQGVHLFKILGIRQWPIPQEQYSFSKSSLRISKMCVRELHETIREDIIHTPNIHLISKNTMAARHPAVWRLINYLELVARLNHSGNERRGDYRRFFVATKAGEMSIEVVTTTLIILKIVFRIQNCPSHLTLIRKDFHCLCPPRNNNNNFAMIIITLLF